MAGVFRVMTRPRTSGSPYADRVVTCDLCGATHEGEAPPLTWSLSMERGQAKRYCDRCTRDQLRLMEGKLDVGEGW